MKTTENMQMQGRITLLLSDREGRQLERLEVDNNIVLDGRDLVAQLFIGIGINPVKYLAVGTASNEVSFSDKTLGHEVFRKALNPVDILKHFTTTDDHRRKVTLSAELGFDDGIGPLTEAALFNEAAGGVMYNRVVFPSVNKTAGIKLTLIWEIIF